MIEETAKWMTFNSKDFKSQCCRCQSSLTLINSCISSSQSKIIKNEIKKSKEKISKVSTKNNQTGLCQKMSSIEINKTKSNCKSKFRSVSVDDLESVVKQLIEEALEDDEETIQLQMVVCREDFLQQYMNEKSENRDSEQTLEISNNIKEKYEKNNLENIVSKINYHDEIQTNKKSEKNMEKIPSSIKLNGDSTILIKESERRKNEETKNIENSHKSEGIVEFKGLKPPVKKILRSKLTKNEETNDQKKETATQETIQSKGDFTFEAWKQAKTRAYKQLLKEEKRKRQRKLLENAKKMERERTAHIEYLNWKRDHQKQQKLKRMNVKAANERAMALKMKSDEKRYANLQAFKEWKKREDTKIKREKMAWRADCQQSYLQNSSTPPGTTETCKPNSNLDFDTLLNQLDNVLHKKYLKDRRFQVRSLYCQPNYFGTAALI